MGALITRVEDLSPKQRAFIEHYINTGDAIESYFAAGYLEGCDQNDKKYRDQASRAARNILVKPLVHEYVMMNKALEIPETGDIDMKAITDRMFLICMGRVERRRTNDKGDVVLEAPTFREQIEAGKLLNAISEKREKKTDKRASKALTAKVAALIGAARSDGQETED